MYKGVSALVAALASTMSALATITPSLAAGVSFYARIDLVCAASVKGALVGKQGGGQRGEI